MIDVLNDLVITFPIQELKDLLTCVWTIGDWVQETHLQVADFGVFGGEEHEERQE